MSIFSKIKDAIFGHSAQAATPPAEVTAAPVEQTAAPVEVAPAPVDVEASLGGMDGSGNLNWQSSIVDLMKLVGIDSSYENRKSLATELGNASYSGSAEDNIQLHRQVMQALADNGGHVPASMLG